MSVIRLRHRKPDLSRPLSIPFYSIPPLLVIGFNALLGLFISPGTWLIALGWLAVGALVYLVWQRYKTPTFQSHPTTGD